MASWPVEALPAAIKYAATTEVERETPWKLPQHNNRDSRFKTRDTNIQDQIIILRVKLPPAQSAREGAGGSAPVHQYAVVMFDMRFDEVGCSRERRNDVLVLHVEYTQRQHVHRLRHSSHALLLPGDAQLGSIQWGLILRC